jgi:hypothetical protein
LKGALPKYADLLYNDAVKRNFAVLMVMLCGASLFSQSGSSIDELLSSDAITWRQACFWIYSAAGVLPDDFTENDAIVFAFINKDIPKNAWTDGYVDLQGLSYLIMKSYGINGGLMYKLTHSRRYAFRELIFRRILQQSDSPSDTVSGERLLKILQAVESVNFIE